MRPPKAAGVLTQLAGDPLALAQVARLALGMMHFDLPPDEAWTVEGLTAHERRGLDGQRICEAGCYRCLLSYFSQPDHKHISRRDAHALTLLVALANAQVVTTPPAPSSAQPSIESEEGADGVLTAWLAELIERRLRQPDATRVSVCEGTATAAAQFKAARALVFLEPLADETRAALADKGWQALDFSDRGQWAAEFAQSPDVFGHPQVAS